jgi:peptidoglycan/xylan/chitin deacetylase (PgdA/CDA1 family)
VSHAALATLEEPAAFAEVADNRRFLQELLDQPVDHFAYPYGNPRACAAREAGLVARAGYRTAVTTRQATVRRGGSDPLFLPRIRAPEAIRPASFDGRVSGLYFALRRSRPDRARPATSHVSHPITSVRGAPDAVL